MENKNYYEPRYVNQSQGYTINWFGEDKNSKILFEVVLETYKIVLLGNPGVGKTKELETLFEKLWKEKDSTGIIPFSINLKNFRKINRFEDLIIYQDWKSLAKVIFILDGLDEIAEIHDFVSAFELFISQNKHLNISYIISCRTNIYEKYLVNISNFQSFYLQDLSAEQSISLLANKYGVDISKFKLQEKHLNYLKTPFFLELFAGYVLERGILPVSDSVMWELFIKKTLEKHEEKQTKKRLVNKLKMIKDLKKVAFTNELMQQNYSTAEELEKITGDYLEYIENPFTLELSGEPKHWSFVHRQIQEYLVAKILSEKEFDDILQIIKIQNIEKEVVHPSLFNTITFLINLLDKNSETFKKLIGWLISNQIEILFKADSDRTGLFKEHVFQEYFNRQCIEKKLWISTNRTFSVKEIAEFGDCDKNFTYLVKFVKEQKEHFRVIISALNLISFFEPSNSRQKFLCSLFLELLSLPTVVAAIKSEILRCITSWKICENDQDYLDKIMEIFREECNKEINAALLYLINHINDIDRLFWYIKDEFLRTANIEKRKDFDEVHRGNDWKLLDLILRFEDSNNFIEIVSYYFFDAVYIDFYNHHLDDLQKRFLFFALKEDDFVIRLLKAIHKKTSYHNRENILISIINDSGKQLEAAEFLVENNDFSEVRGFIARFANYEVLDFIIENQYKTKRINSEDVIYFRNNLTHYNIANAVEFEKMMIEEGFEFETNVMDEKQLEIHNKDIIKNIQTNFDLLFKTKKLLHGIKSIYNDNNAETLEIDDVLKLNSAWRKEKNYPVYHDSRLTILQLLIDTYGFLSYTQVAELLDDKIFIFKAVLDSIKGNNRENIKFIISLEQKNEIFNWIIQTSENINFNNIVVVINETNFRYGKDFEAYKIVLSFQKLFNIPIDKEFFLRSLKYYDIDNFNEKEESFAYLFKEINDKELFNKQVIENILEDKMFKFIIDRHVDYALKNNLKDTYPKIREYFLRQNPGYNLDEKLELYFKLTDDADLLMECCSDVNNPLCWSAIKLLVLEGKEKFCIEKAVEYLEQEESDRKVYYLSNAMWVLFHFNKITALDYYFKMKKFDFHGVNFSDYSVIDDYDRLQILFFSIYKEVNDKPDFNHAGSFFHAYISNLSRSDKSFIETQKVLNEIKQKLLLKESDTRLFNINLLIDSSNNSYINSKSVPLSFFEALDKVAAIEV